MVVEGGRQSHSCKHQCGGLDDRVNDLQWNLAAAATQAEHQHPCTHTHTHTHTTRHDTIRDAILTTDVKKRSNKNLKNVKKR